MKFYQRPEVLAFVIISIILSSIVLPILYVTPANAIANAAWYNTDWSYRRQVTVIGSPASALTNYQLRLTVNYAGTASNTTHVSCNSHCRSDFGDLRFTQTDGTTALDYYIESYTGSVSAVVWIELNSIPRAPSTTTFYMYYGNMGATSASSGKNTFILFEDFEDGTATNSLATDPHVMWTVVSGNITYSNTHAYAGSLSGRFAGAGGSAANAYASLTASNTTAVRWWQYKDISASSAVYEQDSANVRYWDIRVHSDETIWANGDTVNTGSSSVASAWRVLEMNNIQQGIFKYDIYHGSTIPPTFIYQGTSFAASTGTNRINFHTKNKVL